jgi:hypothetical protein
LTPLTPVITIGPARPIRARSAPSKRLITRHIKRQAPASAPAPRLSLANSLRPLRPLASSPLPRLPDVLFRIRRTTIHVRACHAHTTGTVGLTVRRYELPYASIASPTLRELPKQLLHKPPGRQSPDNCPCRPNLQSLLTTSSPVRGANHSNPTSTQKPRPTPVSALSVIVLTMTTTYDAIQQFFHSPGGIVSCVLISIIILFIAYRYRGFLTRVTRNPPPPALPAAIPLPTIPPRRQPALQVPPRTYHLRREYPGHPLDPTSSFWIQ